MCMFVFIADFIDPCLGAVHVKPFLHFGLQCLSLSVLPISVSSLSVFWALCDCVPIHTHTLEHTLEHTHTHSLKYTREQTQNLLYRHRECCHDVSCDTFSMDVNANTYVHVNVYVDRCLRPCTSTSVLCVLVSVSASMSSLVGHRRAMCASFHTHLFPSHPPLLLSPFSLSLSVRMSVCVCVCLSVYTDLHVRLHPQMNLRKVHRDTHSGTIYDCDPNSQKRGSNKRR